MSLVKFGGALAAVMMLSTPVAAMSLVEDFSGGLNGWSVRNTSGQAQAGGTTNSGAALAVPLNGGPAGTGDAFLQASDNRGGYAHVIFGNGWTGDLSGFDGSTFSVDYLQSAGRGGFVGSFGTLRVTGGGLSAVLDVIGPNPTSTWQTAEADFTASAFGVSDANWSTILGDVTEIRLQSESVFGVNEVVGFDNITLAPVPLPAGGALLLGALGYLGLRRARRA